MATCGQLKCPYMEIYSFRKVIGLQTVQTLICLTGCIGEIIAFYKTLNDQETSHTQEYLMKKWGITDTIVSYGCLKVCRGE